MAAKKKAGSRSRKAAKRSKRTGTRKTAKTAARATASRKPARKATARKGARKAGTRKTGTRKATSRKSTARKSPPRKSTARKTTIRKITGKAARGVSTLRQSLVRSLPEEGVGAAVKEKARQGFELAREGLERLKDTTVGVTATVIENVKERVSRDDDRFPESMRAEPGEPEPSR